MTKEGYDPMGYGQIVKKTVTANSNAGPADFLACAREAYAQLKLMRDLQWFDILMGNLDASNATIEEIGHTMREAVILQIRTYLHYAGSILENIEDGELIVISNVFFLIRLVEANNFAVENSGILADLDKPVYDIDMAIAREEMAITIRRCKFNTKKTTISSIKRLLKKANRKANLINKENSLDRLIIFLEWIDIIQAFIEDHGDKLYE